MKAKLGLAALLLSVLFWAPGGPAAQLAGARLEPLQSPLLQPASVTIPPEAPVVVDTATAVNSRGWAGSPAAKASEDLTDDVLAAYTLAVAISPESCHLTTPMLASIGQVESGNLADHTLDASHRVVPGILGPVLDGKTFRAVADTDGGQWDGNTIWDRALGPMQIIPASWRVVGVDMDGDGVRDPQNIYDAAGAAMVYLCAGGRDLSSADGLREAILSYNNSEAYLRAVLAWKAVFDQADLSGMGAVPFVAALGMPTAAPLLVEPTPTPTPPRPTTTSAAEPVTPGGPSIPASSPDSTPSTSTSPSTGPQQPATPSPKPAVGTPPATTPPGSSAPDPTQSASPEPSDPTVATPDPTPPATEEPTPTPDPKPDPTPEPTPLPECPVPTTDPVTGEPIEPAADPAADPAAQELVVSPETCTPPEGYAFDPETGELVLVPETTPAP